MYIRLLLQQSTNHNNYYKIVLIEMIILYNIHNYEELNFEGTMDTYQYIRKC